jgi:hypothetical protein
MSMHLFSYLRLSTSHVRTNQPDKSPANRKERAEAAKKEYKKETDSGVWFCGNLWVVTLLCENKKLMTLKTHENERT